MHFLLKPMQQITCIYSHTLIDILFYQLEKLNQLGVSKFKITYHCLNKFDYKKVGIAKVCDPTSP